MHYLIIDLFGPNANRPKMGLVPAQYIVLTWIVRSSSYSFFASNVRSLFVW